MRKNNWKRWIAAMAAVCMLGEAPLMNLQAQPMSLVTAETELSQQEESLKQEAELERQAADAAQELTIESAGVSGADVPRVGEGETPGGEQIAGEAQEQERELTGDLLLNYVYIENAYIEAPDMEHIMVSLGEENTLLTQATLEVTNKETGEVISLPLSDRQSNCLVFDFDTTAYLAGIYQVTGLHYTYLKEAGADETFGFLAVAEIPDMNDICFGVNREVMVEESALTELEAEALSDGISAQQLSEMLDINVISLEGAEGSSDEAVSEVTAALGAAQQLGGAEEIEAQQAGIDGASYGTVAGSVVIVLDAGHDNTHVGARANGLNEEALTLKVAEYCKAYLEANYTNVVVYMTRTSGACPFPGTSSGDDNAARVAYAKSVGADAYVSIHFNTTGTSSTTATGAIVFYPNSNYNNSVGSSGSVLASKIIEQLAALGLRNNGIQTRNSENNTTYADGSLADYYQVIRLGKEAGFPAVIVEHAFLNNASDASWLSSEDNLKNLGYADAKGIANAYNLSTEEVEYDAEDLVVTEIDGANGSFKITLTGATPTGRIASVKFKVYPTDDSSASYLYTASGNGEGTYTATANVSNHDSLTGKYKIVAYAYDAAGKRYQLRSTTATIEEAKVDLTKISLATTLTASQKTASIYLKGNSGAAAVSFKVYSNAGGNDDSKTYKATKLSNGYWKAKVTIADHKSAGDYTVLAYSKSYFGKTTKVATGSFTVDGPSFSKLQIKKVNLNKGTFQLRLTDVKAAAGVKNVQVKVRNNEGSKKTKTYTLKRSASGYYYVNIKMKDHNYQLGKYRFAVTITDKTGIEATSNYLYYTFEKPEPVLTAKLKAKQSRIEITASSLGLRAGIKNVKFTVYNTSDSSKKKSYLAKANTSGVWSAKVSVADFGTAGTYKVVTYVKGLTGGYKRVGTRSVTVDEIAGGKVSAKRNGDTGYTLDISSISCNAAISKVEVRTWPTEKKSAKYTYTAKLRTNGKYRASVKIKNHDNMGGTYRYQVIVTCKNGVKTTLLQGRVELEETAASGDLYAITGASTVTVTQMVNYYKDNATYPSYYKDSDASTLKKFCQMYYNECQAEGIRAEVAFAQAMKETNFLRFGGDVNIAQYNFAGLGATGGGVSGLSFSTVRLGVRAQVQHLKAYANTLPLNQAKADPRFDYVSRGSAPYVEWLGISENPYGKGWATDIGYGIDLRDRIDDLKSY